MHMSLSGLQELVLDREAWRADWVTELTDVMQNDHHNKFC